MLVKFWVILIVVFCGVLYFNIKNDIPGFQNRLGLFFFVLAMFGFGALTSLNTFSEERQLFLRERSNNYYSALPYFISKVLFDIIPLRVMPPIIMGCIIYPLVGLVPGVREFLSFILVLVLFNLTSAAICLVIGIIFSNLSIASLFGSLIMLFGLLFSGPLLNYDSISFGLQYLQKISVFHYAFEALLVNEVRYLTLTENKFGLEIEVPGATILSTFGFNSSSFWTDIGGLVIYFSISLIAAFTIMQIFLVEKR